MMPNICGCQITNRFYDKKVVICHPLRNVEASGYTGRYHTFFINLADLQTSFVSMFFFKKEQLKISVIQ